MHVLMRSGHRHAPAGELSLDALREDRFIVPAEDLNAGFNRRLRRLCREHGFEPLTIVAPAVWEDAERPAGDDLVALATERVARHSAPHMRTALLVPALYMPLELVWREDDDSPVLQTFLALATPSPQPAHGS
jgi:hypothetical protein